VVGLRIGQRGRQAGLDAVQRQRLHDDAGGERQHLLGRHVQCRASAMQVARARTRPSSPVPAFALPVLITIARMSPVRQVLAADLHRRGAEAVAREHARRPPRRVEQEDGEVLAVGLADARFGDADAHARARVQRVAARGALRLTAMDESEKWKSVLAPGQAAQAPAALAAAVACSSASPSKPSRML
jgi:hypothetical protein